MNPTFHLGNSNGGLNHENKIITNSSESNSMNDLIIREKKRTMLSQSAKLPKQDNEIKFVSTNKFSVLEDPTNNDINDDMLIDDDASHKQQKNSTK